jgi:hypothetical protein
VPAAPEAGLEHHQRHRSTYQASGLIAGATARRRRQTLVGIYLWQSKADAERFYTPEWIAMVTKRWNAPPVRQQWTTPMVVESAEQRLVKAA